MASQGVVVKHGLLLVLTAIAAAQEPGPWRVVFERDGNLRSVREDGSDSRAEKGPAPKAGALSPDGKRIVYAEYEEGGAAIWTSDPDGSNPRRLTDNRAADPHPGWMPDGKRIVFASGRSGTSQVWIMDADGSDARRLTNHDDGAGYPRISPGGRIAYDEFHDQPREKLPPVTLRTMNLDGSDSKVLVGKTQMLGHEWSPAGDRLAISLVQELRIVDAGGKTVKSFDLSAVHKDLHAHAVFGIVWRPDGKALA